MEMIFVMLGIPFTICALPSLGPKFSNLESFHRHSQKLSIVLKMLKVKLLRTTESSSIPNERYLGWKTRWRENKKNYEMITEDICLNIKDDFLGKI